MSNLIHAWEYATAWLYIDESDAGFSDMGEQGFELVAVIDVGDGRCKGIFKRHKAFTIETTLLTEKDVERISLRAISRVLAEMLG